MLRAGDLMNLEDEDIDMKTMTLRIRDGKFGKSAILPIPKACVQTLEQYLQVRPCIEIGGKHPVFFTDHKNALEFFMEGLSIGKKESMELN